MFTYLYRIKQNTTMSNNESLGQLTEMLRRRKSELSKDQIISAASRKARIAEVDRTLRLIDAITDTPAESEQYRGCTDGYSDYLRNN